LLVICASILQINLLRESGFFADGKLRGRTLAETKLVLEGRLELVGGERKQAGRDWLPISMALQIVATLYLFVFY
jgi:hypothetical protein